MSYIYRKFKQYLCINNEVFKDLCAPEHIKYLVEDEAAAEAKAMRYSRNAFTSFKEVDHLIGMWRCKHNELIMMTEQEKEQDGGRTKKKANEYKLKYI